RKRESGGFFEILNWGVVLRTATGTRTALSLWTAGRPPAHSEAPSPETGLWRLRIQIQSENQSGNQRSTITTWRLPLLLTGISETISVLISTPFKYCAQFFRMCSPAVAARG